MLIKRRWLTACAVGICLSTACRLEQASDLVSLPPSARITHVHYGDWSGDGMVTFRLPSTRSSENWLDEIWRRNPVPKNEQGGDYKAMKNVRQLIGGGHHRILSFDRTTSLYTYDILLEK